MGPIQKSELFEKISRQFQLALGEKMFENYHGGKREVTISDIVFSGSLNSGFINLFPCDKNSSCASEAVFVSFSSDLSRKNFTALRRDQFISLDRIMQKMVQQVLGNCAGINKHVLLITDHLDSEVLSPWMPVINQMMQNGIEFEMVYLNSNGQMNLVDLAMYI
jgi:hypothetical protein